MQRDRVFPWQHGSKTWYSVWNRAEKLAGVNVGLHDLKRYSGELALRAGATMLELQQHMDHADIKTTLEHYCRPQTRDLVNRITVPIPNGEYPDPLAGSGIEERMKAAEQLIDEIRLSRLLEAGIDMQRLAAAISGKRIWETSSGTILTVFDGKEVC